MAENTLLIEDLVGRKAFDQLEALELDLEAIESQVAALVKGFAALGRSVESANDIRTLAAAQQDMNRASRQAVDLTRQMTQTRQVMLQATRERVRGEKDLADALQTTAKSIKEAREQNKLLTAARNATVVTDKAGVDTLNRLNAKIDANNKFIKENGDQALRQKLNIGNYASALDGLGGKFGGLTRQVKGWAAALKSLPLNPLTAALGAAGAAASAAVGVFRLWTSATAAGEEAASRLNTQLRLIRDNFKNNVGYALTNPLGQVDEALKNRAAAADEIVEISKKEKKSATDIFRLMTLGLASEAGALDQYAGGARKALTVVEQVTAASARLARTDTSLAARREAFAKESYTLNRDNIDALGVMAALEREIALLREKARDPDTDPVEASRAVVQATETLKRLEELRVGLARRQVDLVKEGSELTNTRRFYDLKAIDELTSKYEAERDSLLAVAAADGQAAARASEYVRVQEELAAVSLEIRGLDKTLKDPADDEAYDQARERLLVLGEEGAALRARRDALLSQDAAVKEVADSLERLGDLERNLADLTALRRNVAGQATTQELKDEEEAMARLLSLQARYADERRSLSSLKDRLEDQDAAKRRKELADYTSALKDELENRVSAARAAADRARDIYKAMDNEGLDQLADAGDWVGKRQELISVRQQAEEELIRKSAEKEIELLALAGEEAVRVTDKMNADLLRIAEKYGIEREKLAAENARIVADAAASQMKAEMARVDADIAAALDRRNIDLLQALERGEISYAQYNKRIAQAQRDALREQLRAQMDYYQRVMAAEGVSLQERRNALAKLSQLYKQVTEANIEETDKGWGDLDYRGKFEQIANTAQDVWSVVTQAVSASLQNQITALNDQQRRIDEDYEKRIEQVKAMGLGQRQEELETARLEREHADQTEQLEERKAELQKRQARWNQANSLVQATIAGAVAVMQAYAQAGPIVGAVFAAIVAATTAAQIAVIASQKIPEYKKGRKGGPAELAVVGDGGVPEVVETPSGETYLTPGRPTLTYLGKGDKVWRNVEEYLFARKGDNDVVGELRALRRQNRDGDDRLASVMAGLGARLHVTSAGLAWLKNNNQDNGRA